MATLDERSPWLGRSIRGRIELHPGTAELPPIALDADGRHTWWCVAPHSEISVDLSAPRLHFHGHGYFDTNAGSVPLETSFARWDWSRTRFGERTRVLYDAEQLDGTARHLGFETTNRGHIARLGSNEPVALPATRWGLARTTQALNGERPQLVRTLEDTPFYARSLLRTHERAHPGWSVHETLDLRRFDRASVRFLLPFRMRGGFGR